LAWWVALVVVVVEEGIVAVPAGARIGICGGKLNCFVDGIYIIATKWQFWI
jgi:hypothetical protein